VFARLLSTDLRLTFPLRSRLSRIVATFAVACLLGAGPARAAEPPAFTQAELDQMLASIALFPDALLSQVLMASTYPSDVARAADWAYANRHLEGDAAVTAVQDKPWDPSVQSLVAFPQALAMLGEDPRWVRNLGDAFLAQPGEVMDSVQYLRARARDAGNLESNENQIVTIEPAPPPPQVIVVNAPPPPAQIITIAPANPQVVFVPIYHPSWAFGPWWHPAFPPFFFPPPPRWGWGWGWGPTVRVGVWWGPGIHVRHSMWGGVNWHQRNVNINVNHWNTINVNRRIDSRDRNVNWRHDGSNRHGTRYRGAATRDRLQPPVGDPRTREAYRGRDLQRDNARGELSNRMGGAGGNPRNPASTDRGSLNNVDRSQLPQRPAGGAAGAGGNPRNPATREDRGSIDRSQVPPLSGTGGNPRNPAGTGVNRGQVQNRAANVDPAQRQNWNNAAAGINRDNAMRGAGNAAQTRQQVDRGTASLGSMQQQQRNSGQQPQRGTGPRRQ
jgi:hypothetical protein